MLYLSWALLNIAITIYFGIVYIKTIKLIREKIGVVAAFIFVLALLSFVSQSDGDNDNLEPDSNQVKTWKFNSADSLDKWSNEVIITELEKTLISTYSLGISYGKDTTLKYNIPVSANTWTSGFQGGTGWKPLSILVNRTNNNQQFEYEVNGIVKWNLLGMTIYKQTKNWKGIATVK
ncbi:hypothetical protein BH11BAC3_BH11BAC3_44580 [soil metagenome]